MVVPRGEVFGFLGPNGSGKTTAVKLLLGLSRPTGGEAWVLGHSAGDRKTRSRVGYLPELFRYQGWLSAAEVLGRHCRLAGVARAEWPTQIAGALSTVGLTGHADAKVFALAEGLSWKDTAGRNFNVPARELREWIGMRADAGRLPPKGFPKNNRFE